MILNGQFLPLDHWVEFGITFKKLSEAFIEINGT